MAASPDRDEGRAQALRRGLLFAGRPAAPVQDLIDCAALAVDAGLPELAAALSALVSLQLGSVAGAWLRDGVATAPGRPTPPPGFAFDRAIAELRGLTALRPKLAPEEGPAVALLPAEIPVGTSLRHGLDPEVLALARNAVVALVAIPPAGNVTSATALRALARNVRTLPPVAVDEHVGAPPEILGALLVLEELRRFIVDNAALLDAGSEADALFARAAALERGALGPYFSNVRLLIRNVRDVFALIDAAADGTPSRAMTETWCVLLSAHLKPHQLTELADELGDRGMGEALHHLLVRIARAGTPRILYDTVRRIRDVALDVRDYPLAADAQHMFARARRADANEWRILGDIAANAGDASLTDAAYDRALLLAPHDAVVRHSMALARDGTPIAIAGGYEVPPGRTRLRRARVEAYRGSA